MPSRESRYQLMFEHTPVALWEEDFTEVYAAFDDLRARGVADFRGYFNAHPEAAGALAAKVHILDMNLHAISMYEAASKEELLTSIDKTFEPDSFGIFVDELVTLAEGGTFFEAEASARTLKGRRIHVLLQLKILDRSEGSVQGLLSILDISYRKRVEKELEARNTVLQRSNRDLEQFASMASHDLQEPLRMMASYAQLMAKRYGRSFDDKARMYLDYIIDGAERLRGIVGDLLALSRLGTQEPRLQPTELARVLEEVIRNLAGIIGESGATVTHDSLPRIMGNGRQLSQLLQNLIANGIKFRGPEVPRIHVSARRQDDEWCIAVEDNGIGIEAAQHEAIFDVFHRLHGRAEYAGNGIGLAIAKRIMERHEGRIWVESEVGQGTKICFTLAAAD